MALFCTSVLGSAATRVAWQAANPAPGAPYVDEFSAAPLACEEATRAAATVTAAPAAAPTRSDMRADIWRALMTTLAGRGILRCRGLGLLPVDNERRALRTRINVPRHEADGLGRRCRLGRGRRRTAPCQPDPRRGAAAADAVDRLGRPGHPPSPHSRGRGARSEPARRAPARRRRAAAR